MTLKLLMNRSRSSSFASSCFSDDDGTSSLRCLAPMALRMQVRKSATGSLTDMNPPGTSVQPGLPGCCLAQCVNFNPRAPRARAYQLDLTTPGICPESASSRKQMRHMPKSRRNARGRPQRWHRLYARTLNFGVRFHFSTIDFFATLEPPRLALPERHVHELQQFPALFIVVRGGDDGDVHAAHLADLLDVDLREDDLLGEPDRVVAAAVERPRAQAPEVADTRRGHVHEPVEELVHARATERDHAADRQPGAQLEVRDGLLRLADRRLLAADLRQLVRRDVHVLDVGRRVAHAHVDDDLHEARRLHDALVAELLHERRHNLLAVVHGETRLLLRARGPAGAGLVVGPDRGTSLPRLLAALAAFLRGLRSLCLALRGFGLGSLLGFLALRGLVFFRLLVGHRLLLRQRVPSRPGDPLTLAVLRESHAHAHALARLRVVEHDVREVDRSLLLEDAALL